MPKAVMSTAPSRAFWLSLPPLLPSSQGFTATPMRVDGEIGIGPEGSVLLHTFDAALQVHASDMDDGADMFPNASLMRLRVGVIGKAL